MGLSSPGIGSNLDINGIVSKLMQVEAQPLTTLDRKEASYQARLTAFGTLSGALSSFQSALSALATPAKFQAMSGSVADASIGSISTTEQATAGSYSLNVTQLARAQTLSSTGLASSSSAIGSGGSTRLTFQFGSIGFGSTGSAVGAGVASAGIAAGALSINGSTVNTSASTNSARALAEQINLLKATTGVTASAQTTDSGVLAFSDVGTAAGDSWSLSVAGVSVASVGASASMTAAELDAALATAPMQAALSAKGIQLSGTAAGLNLRFTSADGSNIDILQTLTNSSGTASGGIAGLVSGVANVVTAGVKLESSSAITIAGSDPTAAGLSAGISSLQNGVYSNGSFTLDASQSSGSVVIDGSNNSLQGIRDAINKANLGVTASIVSDGSDTPYHLVLSSARTGLKSSMKISVDGNEPVLASLLAYDPAGQQNLRQSGEAQNTLLNLNGIAVSSANNIVAEAVQGTTLTINKIGSTTLTVSRDTSAVSAGVNSFVAAYNSLQKGIATLTAYDSSTKKAGLLNGDGATRQIQALVRNALTTPLQTSGGLSNLTQLGIAYAKDGSMTLDSGKLQSAIGSKFSDIGALFATIGQASDSLVRFTGSGADTKAGAYGLQVTRMATQGELLGSANLQGTQTVIAAGASISVTLDGNNANVTLAAGSYSASQLASMLQSAINGNPSFAAAGSSVTTSVDGSGRLKLVSARYGSASNVSVGNAGIDTIASSMMGAAPTSASSGVDVAGSIGGVAATGSGRTLKTADGLAVEVTGGAIGERGTINFSHGYATALNRLIGNFIGTGGMIEANTRGINSNIRNIVEQRSAMNARLVVRQKQYLAQFAALDSAIGKMNQTSTYLTQQIAQISANSDK